tara:strand:- start:66 stop:950 length:885 start_codon:yes stop_codon:yes gene_type:complete
MISIVIPTYNNLSYLKLCIESIKKNSKFTHEIKLHINDGSDGTLEFAKKNNILFTHSNDNIGLCSAINKLCSTVHQKYILYAHDDMYFCPGWDVSLIKEISNFKDDNFFLSGTLIEAKTGHIKYNCGDTFKNFDEKKLLNNYKNLNFYDYQGSHYAPHLVSKRIWEKVNGFSEEFNPGVASDPDFNMKLWVNGIRIFKGINDFKVYHFASTVIKKLNVPSNYKMNLKSKGSKTFLLKWGISIKFFKKFYLKTNSKYRGPLPKPEKNLAFLSSFLLCKVHYFYIKLFYNSLYSKN